MHTIRCFALAALLTTGAIAQVDSGRGFGGGDSGACPGDTNGDGAVNFLDLNAVLSTFNQVVPPNTGGDVTGDGLVGFADLNLVISSFNLVCVFDAQLVSIARPDTLFAGQPYTITLTVRHTGLAPANIPLEIFIGADFPRSYMLTDVAPGQDVQFNFSYTAPAASSPCADGDPFTISARLNHFFDPDGNPSNDFAETQTILAALHWDLTLEIIGAPTSAEQCETITWTVRVRNTGNMHSWPSCMRSGINCAGGPGQWSCTMGTISAFIFDLPPGGHMDIPFSLNLPCWTLAKPHWLKAEMALDTGCSEFCPPGNFVEMPIEILPQSP